MIRNIPVFTINILIMESFQEKKIKIHQKPRNGNVWYLVYAAFTPN